MKKPLRRLLWFLPFYVIFSTGKVIDYRTDGSLVLLGYIGFASLFLFFGAYAVGKLYWWDVLLFGMLVPMILQFCLDWFLSTL